MVVTDMPFCQPDALQSRYALLKTGSARTQAGVAKPKAATEEVQAKDSQEYAAFLKEKERRCGPDGFLDSGRFQHSFEVRQTQNDRDSAKGRSTTVVDLTTRKDRDQRDYERRLKVIELPVISTDFNRILTDHMWQHKQEERELKRIEGDIIKNQRAIRRTLRDYENAITKKKKSETIKLHHGMEKYTRETNQHLHTKEDVTKQRIEANITTDQAGKDLGRKAQLTSSDLTRKYNSKMGEMELKRSEIGRLNHEFESRVRQKEEEQLRLKKELADLAIAMNLEVQKSRVQEFDFGKSKKQETVRRIQKDQDGQNTLESKLAKSDGDTKNAEVGRRKLSADLTLTRGHMHLKQREEGRHLQDTGNRLRANISEQKQLTEAALHAELDSKTRQMDSKMQEHEFRRHTFVAQKSKQSKDKSATHEQHFNQKFQKRFQDQTRREHEDGLKFFQKMVGKGEERETNLYNKVRNSEYARQKQEQLVKRIQAKLNEARKHNAVKIKSEISDLTRNERDLQYQLNKEQAQLAKVHSEREDSYMTLLHHREILREDRYHLNEHDREHGRLMRIGTKTDIAV